MQVCQCKLSKRVICEALFITDYIIKSYINNLFNQVMSDVNVY